MMAYALSLYGKPGSCNEEQYSPGGPVADRIVRIDRYKNATKRVQSVAGGSCCIVASRSGALRACVARSKAWATAISAGSPR